MKYLLITLMLFCGSVSADNWDFELDITGADIEHGWRGPAGFEHKAQFEEKIYGFGFTTWHKSNFGVRLGYLKGAVLTTEGAYDYVQVNMKHIASLELLYRYYITEDLQARVGIGTHAIPVPQRYEGLDPTSHPYNDSDNDEGWNVGLQYQLSDAFSVGWRFTHYSRISRNELTWEKGHDELIKGHSLNMAFTF